MCLADDCNTDSDTIINTGQPTSDINLQQHQPLPSVGINTTVSPSQATSRTSIAITSSDKRMGDKSTLSYSPAGHDMPHTHHTRTKPPSSVPSFLADGRNQFSQPSKTNMLHQNMAVPKGLETPSIPTINYGKLLPGSRVEVKEGASTYSHSPPRSIQLPGLPNESFVSSPPHHSELVATKQPVSPQCIAQHPHAEASNYYNQQHPGGRQFYTPQAQPQHQHRPNRMQQRSIQNPTSTWGHLNQQRATAHSKSLKTATNHNRSHPSNVPPSALSGGIGTGSSSRMPSEVLKTLLRKKACLYEPGTSLAISLVTWLVGRKLALRSGYFSRQHLQSGVHAVVGDKIDSGMITRTKVNRCMQIILNSCFHYIIPRPDGVEENGDNFRDAFASKATDDTRLLQSLPQPWDDLEVDDSVLPDAAATSSENKEEDDGAQHSNSCNNKRLVLLCFNENVRSAEDVLRCHNEFIRDAAISSDLFLSADDWRSFFTRKDDDGSQTEGTAESTASGGVQSSPHLKSTSDSCGIPYLSFDIPSEVSDFLSFKDHVPEPWAKTADALGQMNAFELGKFRTSWCCKRYEHNEKLCRFAHVDINNSWLRRNPSDHVYCDKMCPHVRQVTDQSNPLFGCYINTCKDGKLCKFAHSQEEIDYHPKQYKTRVCDSVTNPSSHCSCSLQDICPFSHPTSQSSQRNQCRNHGAKRHQEVAARTKGSATSKHSSTCTNATTTTTSTEESPPPGAPVLMLTPAPISEFENTFIVPGLKTLYRRNCTSSYAYSEGKEITYSNFGTGLSTSSSSPALKDSTNFSFFHTL